MSHSEARAILAKIDGLETARQPNNTTGSRLYERFALRHEAKLYTMAKGEANQPPSEIVLHDVSRDGVSFFCQDKVVLRSTWRVGFLHQGYPIAQQPIIVRHCRQVGPDLFLAGAQFCIETGLLCLLGVAESNVFAGDWPSSDDVDPGAFVPPSEVA